MTSLRGLIFPFFFFLFVYSVTATYIWSRDGLYGISNFSVSSCWENYNQDVRDVMPIADPGAYKQRNCSALLNNSLGASSWAQSGWAALNTTGDNIAIFYLNHIYQANLTSLRTVTGYTRVFHLRNYNITLCLDESCIDVYNNNYSVSCTPMDTIEESEYRLSYYGSSVTFNRIKLAMSAICTNGLNTQENIIPFNDGLYFNFSAITDETNQYPSLSINASTSMMCVNETGSTYKFPLVASDPENDPIYYHYAFDNSFSDVQVIDDFPYPDFNLVSDGWGLESSSCNYTTDAFGLNLLSSCNDLAIWKFIGNPYLNPDGKISFYAYVFPNTTNEYCLENENNEKETCIKLTSGDYGDHYTNLSYWNGSEYRYFGTSYYYGQLGIDFEMNNSHSKICVSGIDENTQTGCAHEYTEILHYTSDSRIIKFYMHPTFNFMWENYEKSYVTLDHLTYTNNSISWLGYVPGDYIFQRYTSTGDHSLQVYYTDSIHTPAYKVTSFPFNIYGVCPKSDIFTNGTTGGWNETISEDMHNYVNSIDNGNSILNTIFYVLLLGLFIYLLIQFRDLDLSLILTGISGTIAAWILDGIGIPLLSAAALLALGVALLVAKSFV